MNEALFFLHILIVALAVISFQKLGKEGLTAIFCIQVLIANLFVLKQMKCFGLTITCTDTYIIGCDFSLGLIQKRYGEKSAKKATYICFFLISLFLLLSQIHLFYQPDCGDSYQPIYNALFKATPRIILSSLIVGFLAQKVNIYLQKKISLYSSKITLTLFGPILLSQLFDTVAFSLLGLYGTVNSLIDIMVMSYLIKVITIVSMSFFGRLSLKLNPELKT